MPGATTDINAVEPRRCANCGAALSGRYCAKCGQDSQVTLTVRHFLEEFIEGVTHFDSTFWRTILPLLFRPGLVTERYLGGKRKFYAPPVRTYLVLSVVYFLLVSLTTSMHVHSVKPGGQEFGPQDCAEFARGFAWLKGVVPDIEGSCLRAQRDQGRELNSALSGSLPKVMFLVLPLVALVQYLIYRRQRPAYVENLIFILHFQSFYFLVGSLFLLVALGAAAVFSTTAEKVTSSLDLVLYTAAAVYLFVATRRVYHGGVLKTVISIF